jgi:hypothetical protein
LSEDNLPAGKAARKREAEIREGARAEAFDKAMGAFNVGRFERSRTPSDHAFVIE